MQEEKKSDNSEANPNRRERNHFLDTVRAFAAIGVVYFHLNEPIPWESDIYRNVVKQGWLGVIVFFVLSGYCIQMAASSCRAIVPFYWRRFCRIYPPYLASLVVVGLVCVICKLATGVSDVAQWPKTWLGWLGLLTLAPVPSDQLTGGNWVYWSLSYEIAFYGILGLTILHKLLLPVIVLLMIGLSAIPGMESLPGLFFLSNWCLFSLGVGLYELCHKRRTIGSAFILSSFVVIFYRSTSPVILTTLISALLIGSSTQKWGRFLGRERLLSAIGEWSYGLYLLHVPLGLYWLARFRPEICVSNLGLHILFDTGVVIVCIAFSALFYYTVERPSIALGRLSFGLKAASRDSPSLNGQTGTDAIGPKDQASEPNR